MKRTTWAQLTPAERTRRCMRQWRELRRTPEQIAACFGVPVDVVRLVIERQLRRETRIQ